jgi:AcrR family transcriptional regulator
VSTPIRGRDPARKERILSAAADLVAQRGYHATGMAEIGAAAGITGSGIYRHFDSKSALLVALLDRVIDDLLATAAGIVDQGGDQWTVLRQLVRDQVRFAVEDRELLTVYVDEIRHLPDDDRRRLRRKQRRYVEEWVTVLGELRPQLPESEARTLVHAAVGTIQSARHHDSGVPVDRLKTLLTEAAITVLTLRPDAAVSSGGRPDSSLFPRGIA